ncbi:MAG TPA: Uma2 family endonuclease [Clostridia bacterium]|nr:Uma2 family endonuclease [Clostridia bacterium]
MKVSATDVKNNFGKYLKQCTEEDIFITKNDHIIAKLSKYDDPSDGYLMIKDRGASYTYSGKRVTYEEFLKITEDNEERYEYIDGEVFLLSSPGMAHQIVLANLNRYLMNWFVGKKCRVFSAPFDVTLLGENIKDKNVVEPDLLVSCDYSEQRDDRDRYTGIPNLVVEILSPGTRSRDYVTKLHVYMNGGVREYWIVDPKDKKVTQYHFEDRELCEILTHTYPNVVRSICFEGLEVPMEDIFME